MPGYKKNYKGRSRQFTNVEELESQRKQEEQRRNAKKVESSSEDEDDEEGQKPIIDIHNPNRVVQKTKKISELDLETVVKKPAELSRREKEELARQESARRYQQLHAEGKTEEARSDLARLAIIRKQREEAAKKREEEKKEKESRAQAGKEASLNAIKSKGGGGGRKKR